MVITRLNKIAGSWLEIFIAWMRDGVEPRASNTFSAISKLFCGYNGSLICPDVGDCYDRAHCNRNARYIGIANYH